MWLIEIEVQGARAVGVLTEAQAEWLTEQAERQGWHWTARRVA